MMKIHSKLLLFIGMTAALAAAAALCIAFIAMNQFLTRFRLQESAYSSRIMKDTAKTAIIYEAKLIDEQANLLFVQLENLLKNTRLYRGQEKKNAMDFVKENPLADQYVRCKFREKEPGRFLMLNSYPDTVTPISLKTHPELIEFILAQKDKKESRSLVYSPGNEFVPASLWLVLSYRTDQDVADGVLSAIMLRLNDHFIPLVLAKDPADQRRYLLFDGKNILCKSPELFKPRHPVDLYDLCMKTNANIPGSAGTRLLTQKDGCLLGTAAANILTPEYAAEQVRLICFFNVEENLPNFFDYIDSRFRMAFLIAVGVALAGLLMLLPVMGITARSIADPIAHATGFANALARNEFPPEPLKMSGAEELVILGKSLNFMRDRLSSTISKLKRSHERESAARREAEDANVLKSELLSRLSIELRNPLNSIKGFSALILKDVEKRKDAYPSELKPIAATIHECAENLNDTVSALIELAKLDQAPHTPRLEETDTAVLLKNVMERNSQYAAHRSVTLEGRYLPSALSVIITDPQILTHALCLAEASLIRLLPAGGKVSVTCGGNEGQLQFCVEDLRPAGRKPFRSLAAAYQCYHNGDKENVTSGEVSSILNLMIMEENAELLGAELSVAETEQGNTRICVSFSKSDILNGIPADSRNQNALTDIRTGIVPNPSHARHGRRRHSEARVLVVDENDLNRRLISMILSDTEAHLEFAVSAAECMKILKNRKFDILILDLDSGNMDGEEILAMLREDRHHETMVVILASYLEEELRRRYLSLGVRHCLLKPINIDILHDAVRQG